MMRPREKYERSEIPGPTIRGWCDEFFPYTSCLVIGLAAEVFNDTSRRLTPGLTGTRARQAWGARARRVPAASQAHTYHGRVNSIVESLRSDSASIWRIVSANSGNRKCSLSTSRKYRALETNLTDSAPGIPAASSMSSRSAFHGIHLSRGCFFDTAVASGHGRSSSSKTCD